MLHWGCLGAAPFRGHRLRHLPYIEREGGGGGARQRDRGRQTEGGKETESLIPAPFRLHCLRHLLERDVLFGRCVCKPDHDTGRDCACTSRAWRSISAVRYIQDRLLLPRFESHDSRFSPTPFCSTALEKKEACILKVAYYRERTGG